MHLQLDASPVLIISGTNPTLTLTRQLEESSGIVLVAVVELVDMWKAFKRASEVMNESSKKMGRRE